MKNEAASGSRRAEGRPRADAGAVHDRIWEALRATPDPEIPVLSIVDLGIVRAVRVDDDEVVHVDLSPTYSGCPAAEVIRAGVVEALREAGFPRVQVRDVLSPPWTSDWITAAGREKLREYGIAPPAESVSSKRLIGRPDLRIACPRCRSERTTRISEFGSTPCKALYRCEDCLEPFDYFKCH